MNDRLATAILEAEAAYPSEASGVTSTPSPDPTNPTDAVAEAARRVHEGEAAAIEHAVEALQQAVVDLIEDSSTYVLQLVQRKDTHIEELTAAAEALGRDAKEFSANLRREGEAILESIRAKTAHVLASSTALRSAISPQPSQES